ncbi:alsin-like isoform X2 [Gigantopelta aegis]|uniref:alsin-like isoform X2 n=1 Tax=Gigantopelta aegis TaxID=1735272 RepID=UPI001B887B44|nr:alsin-like isoform X2 [Gigantopelta aegis]
MSASTDKELDVKNVEQMQTSPTKKGLVYMWQGYSGDVTLQSFPAFLTRQIRRVALGGEHSLFLTSDQEVFSCGGNTYGQLGLGSVNSEEIADPQLIACLSDKGVVDVACGKHHSGAVCDNGDVYCWGDSSHGQCGVDTLTPVTSPSQVEIFTKGDVCQHGVLLPNIKVSIKKLACGAEQTIALSTDGEIWVWGSGIQLGLGETTSALTAQKVSSIAGRTVLDVCCGEAFSMALVEKLDPGHSAHVRPLQKATVTKVQKHFPTQCAACKREIYTYTETNDTCIIEEVHECRTSVDGNVHSMESSCGSNSVDSSLNLAEKTDGDGDGDGSKNDISLSEESGHAQSQVSDAKQTLSVSECLSSVDEDSQHPCSSQHDGVPSSLSEDKNHAAEGSRTPENKSQMSEDKSHTAEKVTNDTQTGSPGSPGSSGLPGSQRSKDDSRKSDIDNVTDQTAILDPLGITHVGGDSDAVKSCDASQAEEFADSKDKKNDPYDSGAVTTCVPGQNEETEDSKERRDNPSVNTTPDRADKQDCKDVSEDSSRQEEITQHPTDKTELSRDKQDKQDVLEDPASERDTVTTQGCELAPEVAIPDDGGGACGGRSSEAQLTKDIGSGDQAQTKEQHVCRPPDSNKELRVKTASKTEPDSQEVTVKSETKPDEPDEIIWRRMVSLEAEAESRNRELENAQIPEGERSETETNAPLQGFLPYSSSMLQSMKSMTTHTLTNIQMSMTYVAKQLTDTDSAPSTIDTPLRHTPSGSSPSTSMSTSLDSLPEGMQDSTFTEARAVKGGNSGSASPVKERSPVKEPSPDESRVSKKSASLRTVWARQDQLDKKQSVSDDDDKKSSGKSDRGYKVVTDTEVWVWGQNKKGQLGVGDSIDRSKPTCLKMFMSRSVIKLVAGASHSLALTAVGQVYSWGNNSYGQLGHTDRALSPIRIKFMKGCHIWDVAAGNTQSLFLADSGSMKPHIFFCGKQPSKDVYTTVMKSTVPIQLAHLKKVGWLRQVSAGGNNCACLLDDTTNMVKVLYEFASSERFFFHSLDKIEIFFLKPLMKSSFFSSLDVYPFKSSVYELVMANINLTHHVCKSLTELSFAIRDGCDICEVSQFYNYSHNVTIFRKYSQCLADFVAIGGFQYVTKVGTSFFEKISEVLRQLLGKEVDGGNHAANFRLAMLQPILRVKDCTKLINKLSENAPQGSESARLLKKVALNWESLKMMSANELALADRTSAFWEITTPKLADMLRVPHRRLLRDSKTNHLVFPTSGRFSSSCLFLLFNDVFVQSQTSSVQVFPLETLWVEMPESDTTSQTGLVVTTPEETIDLIAASSAGKAEWLMALNSAINKVLSTQKSSLPSDRHGSHERLTPPLIRHATYTFTKSGPFKDAIYTGSWLNGKLHGYGELKWADGRKYEGKFKQGLQHGYGVLSIPKEGNTEETHEGNWKDGKLNGHARIRYVSGDCYEGCFKDGQRFGHGVFRQGQHMSSIANIYIGEWLQDKRHGYGVQDDILKGEKYMGMWQDDCCHGKGIVVTLDGMYFEGNFVHNKLSGSGLMLTDDNSCYEGEFQDITQLQGKGTLILPTGDKIEGHFSGSWNEGLKINGTFIKNVESFENRSHHSLDTHSKFYSKLSVPADKKWEDIFHHCSLLLGYGGMGKADTAKAWETVAIMITAGRDTVKELYKSSPNKARQQALNLETLEVIPPHNSGNLTTEEFGQITSYLHKAFDSTFHPFGKLMDNLVDVFRAAYIGVGAHPRLLFHAVEEVRSYIRRIYSIIRLLFPDLPASGGPILIFPASCQRRGIPRTTEEAERFFQSPTLEMEAQENSELITQAGLLYPLLLPKVYPPLFDLYALYNDKEDERYWERIMKLNRQGDVALMAYLGVEQKFWLLEEAVFYDKTQKLSDIREECYASAVDTLQQIGTAFSPIDKLRVLEATFLQITKTVQASLKEDHVWCLDDLFPIFQFVVVRAQIRHLGAEIHLVNDLMETHMQYGELGVMATTLQACYFQIQTEKLSMH